jgi:hypothetical protein
MLFLTIVDIDQHRPARFGSEAYSDGVLSQPITSCIGIYCYDVLRFCVATAEQSLLLRRKRARDLGFELPAPQISRATWRLVFPGAVRPGKRAKGSDRSEESCWTVPPIQRRLRQPDCWAFCSADPIPGPTPDAWCPLIQSGVRASPGALLPDRLL